MYLNIKRKLQENPATWVVTGVAGFIGSNLLESLLKLNQRVIGIDNFSTGYKKNLNEVCETVGTDLWKNFEFIEGDICRIEDCYASMKWRGSGKKNAGRTYSKLNNVDFVLHQAALGSVPRSIEDPANTNKSNVVGFLNMLVAARDSKVKSFVYASSSSVYGDSKSLPKIECKIGSPLSPYAVSKYVNELYASNFASHYGLKVTGLRYFNVFGKRQDPAGGYAAVIPKWTKEIINGDTITIHGDGETTRDFCYVENVVQANILAATSEQEGLENEIFNVAKGKQTSLNQLFYKIKNTLKEKKIEYLQNPLYSDFRAGDIRNSLANIQKARRLLGYNPQKDLDEGLKESIPWYINNLQM